MICPIAGADGWMLCSLPIGHEGPHDMRAMDIDDLKSLHEQVDAIPTLLAENARLTKAVAEAPEFLEAVKVATSAENTQLREALREALALFDATWCPEHGHAPRPEQLARVEELRKLVSS